VQQRGRHPHHPRNVPLMGSSARVPSIDVVRYLEAHGVRSLRFLKFDCEACEWDLLPEWADAGWLRGGPSHTQ